MGAARRFFDKAISANGIPDKVNLDKSGANKAALDAMNGNSITLIKIREEKYLNNIVEQDHRAIKQRIRPMRNFKSFRAASCVLAGIELMHMIRTKQFEILGSVTMSVADSFYALARQVRPM